jgi:hypothetical protein
VGLGLVLIGWVARYFGNQQEAGTLAQDNTITEISTPTSTDEGQITTEQAQTVAQLVTDTVSTKQPEVQPAAVPSPESSTAGFDVVLEVSKRNRAMKRYADLREWGHKVRMRTTDSITFKLSIPIEAPLADSIRHRDSLSRFFGRRVWIETN